MALGDITVSLNLDGRDFALGIENAGELLDKFRENLNDTSGGLRRNQNILVSWAKRLGAANVALNQTRELLGSVRDNVNVFVGGIVNANAELEQMNAVMRGLAIEATSSSDAIKIAGDNVKYLREMSKTVPFEISALQDSFIKFKTAGLDPTDGSVQALVDSVAKFGGSSDQLKRASVAIQQMAGKGVISMEELRQQLGEAVPDAMQLMADGMRMSMSELTKLVSSGTLESSAALRAMLTEMRLSNEGSAESMMRTWQGLVSQFRTLRDELYREIGNAGFFEELKDQISDINKFLASDEAKKWAAKLGEALAEALKAVRFIVDNLDTIVPILKIVAAQMAFAFGTKHLLAFNKKMSVLKDVIGKDLKGSYQAFTAEVQKGKNAISTYRATVEKQNRVLRGTVEMFGTMHLEGYKAARTQAILNARAQLGKAAFAGLATSARMAGRAFSMMLGPAGAIIMIVYEIVQAFDLFGSELDKLRERASAGDALVDSEQFVQLQKAASESAKAVEDSQKTLNKAVEMRNKHVDDIFKPRLAKMQAENIKSQTALTNAEAAAFSDAEDQFTRNATRAINRNRSEVTRAYNQAKQDARAWKTDAENTKKLTPDEIDAEYKALMEKAGKSRNDAMLVYEKETISSQFKTRTNIIQNEKKMSEMEQKARLAGIDKARLKLLDELKNTHDQQNQELTKLSEPTILGGKSETDILTSKYKSFLVQIAGTRAELNDESKKLAQTIQQIANLDIKSATPEKLLAAASELDALTKQLAIKRELLGVDKNIAAQRARLATDLKKSVVTNPYLKLSSGARQLSTLISKLNAKHQEWNATGDASSAQLDILQQKIKKLTALQTEQNAIDVSNSLTGLEKKTDAINRELMSVTELRQARADAAAEETAYIVALEGQINSIAPILGVSAEKLKAYAADYKKAVSDKLAYDNRTAVQVMLDDWSEFSISLEKVWANALSGVADTLTTLVMTGKADFESLTQSIIQMIIKIGIQWSIMKAMTGMGVDMSGVAAQAKGGVVGSAGVQSLKTYARGGVAKANNPQMAIFGEGSMNEAYVPLPDGRRIPVDMNGSAPNVEVNVINQSGQQVQAEQQGQRFDGERFVLDVVLKAANRPGNFRSSMKGALGNG
ncbi:MAG: tape measure protein [Vibrio splendidus]